MKFILFQRVKEKIILFRKYEKLSSLETFKSTWIWSFFLLTDVEGLFELGSSNWKIRIFRKIGKMQNYLIIFKQVFDRRVFRGLSLQSNDGWLVLMSEFAENFKFSIMKILLIGIFFFSNFLKNTF